MGCGLCVLKLVIAWITGQWAIDEGANSRRPLDRLQYVFALCDPVTLIFNLST